MPLPKGKQTVGCGWVFSVKHKAEGTVVRLKARLEAKGHTQSYRVDYQNTFAPVEKQYYGVDYQDTLAPVEKLDTVRVLLSLAVNRDWPLLQFDVKNTFLDEDLAEEVFMDPPPGNEKYPNTTNVCKLKRALSGFKHVGILNRGKKTEIKKLKEDHNNFFINVEDITI